MAEIRVICPECGKRVSLRGLNGHLRFEHDYDLEKAKNIAAGLQVDGTLNRLEQDVMNQVSRLYALKEEAELLRRAREEEVIGEELYERMITHKGHELTATSRYLQCLQETWIERHRSLTGVTPIADVSEEELGVTRVHEEIDDRP
ncbi:MAG: hypothetical protein VX733_13445 [Candidatus Latescibacterota bacterium]|nr:hypothetical protein [Candidatus Latescibacterota bacterium]